MRILLDKSVPEKIGKLLVGHTCSTVQRLGWASIKNEELLALARPLRCVSGRKSSIESLKLRLGDKRD